MVQTALIEKNMNWWDGEELVGHYFILTNQTCKVNSYDLAWLMYYRSRWGGIIRTSEGELIFRHIESSIIQK